MAIDTTSPRSRRAILLGALGAVAASAATAVGRVSPVSAMNGDPVLVGNMQGGTSVTEVVALGADGFSGGSDVGFGIKGSSDENTGIWGSSEATNKPGILGLSSGNSTGVQGHSGDDNNPASPPQKTGVFGYANQDALSVGVRGGSPVGTGIFGVSDSGVAVKGHSGAGRGGQFAGATAQLRLVPSSAGSHPSSGVAGDLFVDNSHRLWFCLGGTTWKRVQLV